MSDFMLASAFLAFVLMPACVAFTSMKESRDED
jgi:hypothetical protein